MTSCTHSQITPLPAPAASAPPAAPNPPADKNTPPLGSLPPSPASRENLFIAGCRETVTSAACCPLWLPVPGTCWMGTCKGTKAGQVPGPPDVTGAGWEEGFAIKTSD